LGISLLTKRSSFDASALLRIEAAFVWITEAIMRKIILYGRLRKKFGQHFNLAVATAGEAVRALGSQIPGFYDELKKGSYEVIRGDRKSGLRLGEEEIAGFNLGKADLHIVPVIKGSKNNGGTLKAVLGVVLIGAAIFFSGGALSAALPLGGLGVGLTGTNVAMIGLGLALTGVSQLLTPDKPPDNSKNQDSFSLSGPGNTVEQGLPLPLIYGEVITGSVLGSAGLDVEPIPVGWNPLTGNYA
jgi:predicted phage tail protein